MRLSCPFRCFPAHPERHKSDDEAGRDGKIKAAGNGNPPAGTTILGPNVSFWHFIPPDDAILKTVANAGSEMVWNPMSNGILDPKLVERGPAVDPYAAVVLACNAMNLAKVYVGGDLLVDTYHLQKNDMSKVSREVNQRVSHLH